MAYFFIAKRICAATNVLYSLVDNKCWDTGCPDGQIKNGTLDLCVACHYTCLKCTGLSSTDCTDCNSTDKRGPAASGKCPCMTGFVDYNVALCPPCTKFMPYCDACDFQNVCTSCTSDIIFVLRADKVGC